MAGIPNPNSPTVNARGGGSSVYLNSSATTAASTQAVTLTISGGTTTVVKYYATLTLVSQLNAAVGGKINVTGITPTGYRGTDLVVTDISETYPYSVTYEVGSALGAQSVAGTVSVSGTHFDTGDYGNVSTGNTTLMQNRTQANVQAFYKDQNTLLSGKKTSLFDGLDPNLPFPVALLKALAEKLVQGTLNAVATVGEVLTHVANWVSGFLNAAGKVIGNIVNAVVDGVENTVQDFIDALHHVFSHNPFSTFVKGAGKSVNDLAVQAQVVTDVTYQTSFRSDTYDGFFATPRVLPGWLGQLSDDVSFPQTMVSTASGTTVGQMQLIPIRASQDRTYTCVKFGMTPASINNMTTFNMAIYDVDETNGDAKKIIDLGNVKSQLSSASDLQTVNLPTPMTVQMGEVYYIAILQLGGTAGFLHMAQSSSIPNYMSPGVYPRSLAMYYSAGTLGAFPSTFTDAQLTKQAHIWGALGTPTPITITSPVTYADSFTRSDSNNLGSLWTTRIGNGLRVVSGKAVANSSSLTSLSTYIPRTNYLRQYNQAQLGGQMSTGSYGEQGMILTLRGDGYGQFIYLWVRSVRSGAFSQWTTEARIYTATSFTGLGTTFTGGTPRGNFYQQNNEGFVNNKDSDVWLFYSDGVNYTGCRNNVAVCTWNDSGIAFAGSGTGNAKFKEIGIGAYYNGLYSTIDNWTAYDRY